MALQSVSPHDCSLLVSIPSDRGAFIGSLRSPESHDFAAGLKQQFKALDDREVWARYKPFARQIRRVCRAVRCHGVTVRTRAQLADLTDLTRRFPVVTLLTHCRFPSFCPDDLLDPAMLVGDLREPNGRVACGLREELQLRRPTLFAEAIAGTIGAERLKAELATVLDEIIEEAHAWYETGEEHRPLPEVRLTRVALEAAFPRAIRSARAIEFDDGMKTVGGVVQAIDAKFIGVLDLIVCTSALFGPSLKWRLQDQTHVPLIVENRHLADMEVRLAFYKLVIGELARARQPFIDATVEVRKVFLAQVKLETSQLKSLSKGSDDEPRENP